MPMCDCDVLSPIIHRQHHPHTHQSVSVGRVPVANAFAKASASASMAAITSTFLSAQLSLSHKSLFVPNYPSLSTSTLLRTHHRISCCVTSNKPISSKNNANLQADSGSGSGGGDLRIIFSAGGTGGHIYPAVAIADELKTVNPNTRILFVGTPTGMESSGIPSAGYDFASVPAVRLARPLVSPLNLFFPYRLIKSMIKSWRKLNDFDPHIVVGTGGYVSFPICLTAAVKGIKLAIHEQNSVPGIANWVLSYFADVVFVAFNSTIDCFPNNSKCVVVGNPVRSSLRQYVSKAVARSHFFPKSDKKEAGDSKEEEEEKKKVVLILGGSLGANAINIAMLNLYYQMLSENKNLFIIWQTGYETYNEMESLVRNHPQLFLSPFLRSMDLAYAAADLIISRAGAMTCSEILATGKPTILIPSPNVAEGHQFKNASLMADLTGSRVITEDELDSTTLGAAIQEILEDDNQMAEMCERALKAAKPNAAAEIAQHILSLVNSSAGKKK